MTPTRTKTVAWLFAEFVVIVIGVLVALAVDQWRERRGDAKLERFFLDGLAADLAKDSADFTNFARQQERRATAAAVALEAAGDASVDRVFAEGDTVITLSPAAALGLIGRTNHLEPTRAAYNTMISTGGISIIADPDLRRSIVDYYVVIDDRLEINRDLETEIGVYRRRLEGFGFTPSDREAIRVARPLADPAMLALIRAMRNQALLAVHYGKELAPMAVDLRTHILEHLDR